MNPVVAIVAPGAMGAAVARRLTDHGLKVLTSLTGRSAETVARATAAGMSAADDDEIAAADFILSIVPPGDALALARRFAAPLRTASTKPVYVDCNAVNPGTVAEIASVIAGTGSPFVDAAIIGTPPTRDGTDPSVYASGPQAPRFAVLRDHGLDVRVLEGPLSAASALKMCYGGITKGMTAIATAMILAAAKGGSSKALHQELQTRFTALPWLTRQVPGMYHRAYRWVAEMEEISEFVGDDTAARDMYRGIAQLYERIAKDAAGDQHEIAALSAFFKPDGK